MPDSTKPAVEVFFTPEFKRNVRALAKKYPQIRSDVQPFIDQIQRGNWRAAKFKEQVTQFSKCVFATVTFRVARVAGIAPFIT